MTPPAIVLLAVLVVAADGRSCKSCWDDLESGDQEERDLQRDRFWRAQITIVGAGTVKTAALAFDCASDGVTQRGRCGPTLLRFKELEPPLMDARAAPGWRLDHWDSLIRERDGGTHRRAGPMPDGHLYLNGFGHSDTGQLETVTAVFVPEGDAQPGAPP